MAEDVEPDSEWDETDLAFMRSLMPENAIPVGLFAVVQFIDPETGAQGWRRWSPFEAPVSQVVGLAMMGVFDMLAGTPMVSKRNVFAPTDDD